jgi:hypothetical protein
MYEFDPEDIHARRTVLRRAIAVGGACSIGCLALGKPLIDATTDGLIATLGGLVAWTIYHLISRRTDAVGLVAMNTLPLWRDPRDPWLPTLVITTLAMIGVGLVVGLVNRPQAEAEPATAEFRLWDAELDGPG